MPESGHETEDIQGLEPVAAGGLEESPGLIRVEGFYLLLADLRLVSVGGRVAGDEIPTNGFLQGRV